jgi:hypothetical protein
MLPVALAPGLTVNSTRGAPAGPAVVVGAAVVVVGAIVVVVEEAPP